MRHIIASGAVTTAAFGVFEAALPAALVVPARLAYRAMARRRRALAGAINLPAVAVAANDHLCPATGAQKESPRRFRTFHWRRSTSRQRSIDRDGRLVKYSPRTRARHGVGHDTGQAWRFELVSCRFLWRCRSTASRSGLASPPAASTAASTAALQPTPRNRGGDFFGPALPVALRALYSTEPKKIANHPPEITRPQCQTRTNHRGCSVNVETPPPADQTQHQRDDKLPAPALPLSTCRHIVADLDSRSQRVPS